MSTKGDALRLQGHLASKLDEQETKPQRFRATMGDGTGTIKVPGKRNYVYIRRLGRGRIEECLNNKAPIRDGLKVIAGYSHESPDLLQILEVDWSSFAAPGQYSYAVPHHESHEFRNVHGGDDVVWVQKQQILPLLVYPRDPSSMFVNVFGGWYPFDTGWHYFEATVSADLSGNVPVGGGGEARFVLIGIDGATENLQYTSGDIFPAFLPPPDMEDRIPAPPGGSIPLAAIYLPFGTTAIAWENIYDLRLFNQPVGGSVSPGVHNLLDSTVHGDTVTQAPSQGSFVKGTAAGAWDELVHPGGAGYALITDANDVLWDQTPVWTGAHTFNAGVVVGAGQGITLPDPGWIGLGAANPRLTFTSGVPNEATFNDCGRVGIENILYHIDDADTYLIFSPDFCGFRVGNVDMLQMTEAAQDIVEVNPTGADVDFSVEAVGVADALQVQGSDGQITLGALGAGTVQSSAAGVLSSGLIAPSQLDVSEFGDMLFTRDDGLLLLNSYCLLTPTAWTATRGQVATISGAFHQELGPWVDSRGLVVEPATTNYELAPRMRDANADGVADGWTYWDNFGSGGDATLTIVAHPIAERGWLQRMQYTAAAGDVNDYCVLYDLTAVGSFTQGDDVTFSMDMKGITTGCLAQVYIYECDAAGITGTMHAGPMLSLTQNIQRTEYTFTLVDADCSRLKIQPLVHSVDDGDSFDVYFGAVNVEKTAFATSFCCGALDYCAWAGAEDDSTSTRVATTVILTDHVGLVSGKDTLTFSTWVQAPYDYDATWPSQWNYIFDIKGPAPHRVYLIYDSVDDRFELYVNGATRASSTGVTFSAGDWLCVVATINYAGNACALYLNGELVGSGNVGGWGSTTATSWALCGASPTGGQSGWCVGEYVVLGTVWTATEVAALYALHRPLVDAGALRRPAIYMLPELSIAPGGWIELPDAGWIGNSETTARLGFDSSGATDYAYFMGCNVGAGTTTPDRLTHAEVSDDTTFAIVYAQRLSHTTSGAAASAFGVGVEHELEDSAGNMQVASAMETLWATATSGVESPLLRFRTYPQGAGGLGKCGFWTWDGVDGTQRIVIPNASPVAYCIRVYYVVRASDGGTSAASVTITPGNTADIYSVGADILTLSVAVVGGMGVQRTGGTLTYRVALWMVWI